MKAPILRLILVIFLVNSIGPMPGYASDTILPKPGVMVALSPAYNPAVLKGIKVHPENPLQFEFVLNQGDASFSNEELREESQKLVKYFLASMTVPEKDLWVNLSPYEKNRIIPIEFGQTEMGRDLLAQDYVLKQIASSLMYPEESLGKEFWKRIFAKLPPNANQVTTNMFNKVWIVPDKALVYENTQQGVAYIVKSRLKVMLESDYLAESRNSDKNQHSNQLLDNHQDSQVKDIVKSVILPELECEINEGKNFAPLRQVYHSLILAQWYKKKIKQSILAKVYVDQNKVKGAEYTQSILSYCQPGDIDASQSVSYGNVNPCSKNKNDTEIIYQQYLKAFKQGVYNYVKEEHDLIRNQIIPRKYFAGGLQIGAFKLGDFAMTTNSNLIVNGANNLVVGVDFAVVSRGQNSINNNDLNKNLAMKSLNPRLSSKQIIEQFLYPNESPKKLLITLLKSDEMPWGDQILTYRALVKALGQLWPNTTIKVYAEKHQSIFDGVGFNVEMIKDEQELKGEKFDIIFKGGDRKGLFESPLTNQFNNNSNQINVFTIYSQAISRRYTGFYQNLIAQMQRIGLITAMEDMGGNPLVQNKQGSRVVFVNTLAETNKEQVQRIRGSFVQSVLGLINNGYNVVINGGPKQHSDSLPGGLPRLVEIQVSEADQLVAMIQQQYEFKKPGKKLYSDRLQIRYFDDSDKVVQFMKDEIDFVLTIDTGIFWAAHLLANKPSVVITTDHSFLNQMMQLELPNYYPIEIDRFSQNVEDVLISFEKFTNNFRRDADKAMTNDEDIIKKGIQPVNEKDLDEVLKVHGFSSMSNIRKVFSQVVIENLLEDKTLEPKFLQLIPEHGLGEVVINDLKGIESLELPGTGLKGIEVLKALSAFKVGSAQDAERILSSNPEAIIIVGLVSRVANQFASFPNPHGRQTFFPLADGTWIGVKGSGQNIDDKEPNFYFKTDRYWGLASEWEAKNAIENLKIFKGTEASLSQFLGYRIIKKLPDQQGGFRNIGKLDYGAWEFIPSLIFNRVATPHRFVELKKLMSKNIDYGLKRFAVRISKALHALGRLPQDKILNPAEYLGWLMYEYAKTEAIKQAKGKIKGTFHWQDLVLSGDESDNEEFLNGDDSKAFDVKKSALINIISNLENINLWPDANNKEKIEEQARMIVNEFLRGYIEFSSNYILDQFEQNPGVLIDKLSDPMYINPLFLHEDGALKQLIIRLIQNEKLKRQKDIKKGGIDLTSQKALSIENIDNGEIKFDAFDPDLLRQFQNLEGFEPIIKRITVVEDIKVFLGILPSHN